MHILRDALDVVRGRLDGDLEKNLEAETDIMNMNAKGPGNLFERKNHVYDAIRNNTAEQRTAIAEGNAEFSLAKDEFGDDMVKLNAETERDLGIEAEDAQKEVESTNDETQTDWRWSKKEIVGMPVYSTQEGGGVRGRLQAGQTSAGSFSALSTPIFASK